MTYLLDTNVLSEIGKSRPNPGVRSWFADVEDDSLHLSVLVLGEIRHGVERLRTRDPAQASALERWLETLEAQFRGRTFAVDAPIAHAWGRINATDLVPRWTVSWPPRRSSTGSSSSPGTPFPSSASAFPGSTRGPPEREAMSSKPIAGRRESSGRRIGLADGSVATRIPSLGESVVDRTVARSPATVRWGYARRVDPLATLSPGTRAWFERAFSGPTPAQELAWPAIASGGHVLVQAPTGSGKTLAAFLLGIDRLNPSPGEGLRLLYVSPLKALNYDIERNLRGPLAGIGSALTVGVRTGDTPQRDRERMLRTPPDVLITTPESLYLLLTSRGRELLKTVETVILDEVHAVAGTKRGVHLSVSLERLERVVEQPFQRIGLSATQRPLAEIGRWVAGPAREIALIDAGQRKELDLEVVVPVEDLRELGASRLPLSQPVVQDGVEMDPGYEATSRSIWPSIYPALLELVRAHRSTIVFVNNRRLAERLALRINELAQADAEGGVAHEQREVARAHHGSLAREQRVLIEEDLKAGRIPCLVATSSLELGIDMGAVDLVVQVESPKSVARGLQRVGRAGHELGATSKGRIFPKFRADLLECAVVAKAMREGAIEETAIPRNPLDVLAQQVVAICADEEIAVDDLYDLIRGSYPFADLTRQQLENVLDMLAGRYPSDEFAELRPRIVWDRTAGVIRGRTGARRLAVTNAGTIPDRGLFGVFQVDGGGRVGELDEEMVYEAREGQTFMLGASTWRIEEITRDRVLVSPAPGVPGAVPFWKGEGVGRPYELGARIGAASRELVALSDDESDQTTARGLPPRRVGSRESPGVLARARTPQCAPDRPDDRRRAVPRRDRGLAGLRPHPVRRPRPRAVVDGARGPPA